MGARGAGRGMRRRVPAWVVRPLPRRWGRAPVLAASGAVALGLGLAVGVGADALTTSDARPAGAQGPPATCAEAQAAWERSATVQVRLSADDPATLRHGFGRAHDALADVSPPSQVAADWTTVQDYLGTVATAVEGAEGDDDVRAAVADAMSGLDTQAMTAAAERVRTFLADDCGEASGDG